MNWLIICAATWGALAVVVVALAYHRARIRDQLDETVTLVGGQLRVDDQAVSQKKLDLLDRWVKALTALVVVFGLAVLLYWVYMEYFL